MEEYFAVKARLFNYLQKDGYAVLNWDDTKVRGLAEKLNCNLITCGFEKGAMLRAENIKEHGLRDGLSFEIQAPNGRFTVNSALVGRSNIYNILMSVAAAYAFGIDREVIIEGIKKVQPIEGRFEKIEEGQDFTCIVDYAHTEDALRKLIEETRPLTKEKLITVFGCGGDRDRTKRPKMGAVATELSDFVFLTSDNPRTEEPMQIIEEIIKGIRKDNYAVQPDRTAAIKEAVSMARAGDTLLIVGKGHENYQEIKGVRHHFSDKEVLKDAIKNK
jgi:UDP-N-acetylmuramoyl-L-alanyl-D-glutamate--2,6-diaminopimelate ligase